MICILAFGDSIVYGMGDSKGVGWVGRLQAYLDTKKAPDVVHNLGVKGDASDHLIESFDTVTKSRTRGLSKKDKLVIMFGVGANDAGCAGGSKLCFSTPDQFKHNIHSLIQMAGKYTDSIVFVGLLLVDEEALKKLGGTQFNNKVMKEHNKILKNVCKKQKVVFVDMFDEWLESDYKKLLDDGLHPNANGYEKMYLKIQKVLLKNKIID